MCVRGHVRVYAWVCMHVRVCVCGRIEVRKREGEGECKSRYFSEMDSTTAGVFAGNCKNVPRLFAEERNLKRGCSEQRNKEKK